MYVHCSQNSPEHPILTRGTHTTSIVFHCAQAIVNQTCILVGILDKADEHVRQYVHFLAIPY